MKANSKSQWLTDENNVLGKLSHLIADLMRYVAVVGNSYKLQFHRSYIQECIGVNCLEYCKSGIAIW